MVEFERIVPEEIHTETVKKSGSKAIIHIDKKYIGRKVFIIIPKTEVRVIKRRRGECDKCGKLFEITVPPYMRDSHREGFCECD